MSKILDGYGREVKSGVVRSVVEVRVGGIVGVIVGVIVRVGVLVGIEVMVGVEDRIGVAVGVGRGVEKVEISTVSPIEISYT